jgi:hypothetical protein
LFIVTGALALAGAVCALALIRTRDFVASAPDPGQAQPAPPQSAQSAPRAP